MTEETHLVICSNPACRKEIREPMLLTILCVTPPEQYAACPYCFAKLQPEEYTEEPALEPKQEETEHYDEPELDEDLYEEEEAEYVSYANNVLEKVKESSFLQRVKSLIPNSTGTKKDKTMASGKPKAKPAFIEEQAADEEPAEGKAPTLKTSVKNESRPSDAQKLSDTWLTDQKTRLYLQVAWCAQEWWTAC